MSYCRWSSNDFRCDVYVYEDVSGGWTTHVAGNRLVYTEELPEPLGEDWTTDQYVERHMIVSAMVDKATRVPIDLPQDGQTFNDPTPGDCADRLEKLREMGYMVPQYAIDCLREEQKEIEKDA